MKPLLSMLITVVFLAMYPPGRSVALEQKTFANLQDSVQKDQAFALRLKQFADSQYNCNTDKIIELDKKLLELKVIELEQQQAKSDSIIDYLRKQVKNSNGKKQPHYQIIYKSKKHKS